VQSGRLTFLGLTVAIIAGCSQTPIDQTASGQGSGTGVSTDLAWTPPSLSDEGWVEPDGREVIQRHADFMKSQQEFMTEALVSYQAIQESGQKLHFNLLQRMAVRRPGHLHWMTLNDDGTTESAWFSDGQFTLLKQPANIWGQIAGPSTIPEMVTRLVDEYSLDVPFRDLLARDPEEAWIDEDTDLWWVGEAWVEGHWTDHVAVRKPGVDFEVWIRKGDEPFIAKMAIVFTEDEGQPVYVARFRNWSTTVPDAITDFTFTPPDDSEQIDVVPVTSQ